MDHILKYKSTIGGEERRMSSRGMTKRKLHESPSWESLSFALLSFYLFPLVEGDTPSISAYSWKEGCAFSAFSDSVSGSWKWMLADDDDDDGVLCYCVAGLLM
jgi:hypothetical protein